MYKVLMLGLLFPVQDIVASDNQTVQDQKPLGAAIVTFIEAKLVSASFDEAKELHDEYSRFFQFLDNNGSQNNDSTLPVFACLQDVFTPEELKQHVANSAAEQKKARQELSSFAKAHGYKCSYADCKLD